MKMVPGVLKNIKLLLSGVNRRYCALIVDKQRNTIAGIRRHRARFKRRKIILEIAGTEPDSGAAVAGSNPSLNGTTIKNNFRNKLTRPG